MHCLKDWIPAIAAQRKNYVVKKGEAIFKEGDPVTGIYFVYEGKVKVHKKWDAEKELILRFAKKGDIVGHLGLGDTGYYPVSATAIEAGIICYISMDFLESTLNVNNSFVIKLMRFFANELQESEKRMRNLAHMPVKGRVAQALISLKNKFGINADGFIDIDLSRQDLAAFTGAAYESLFRTINDLVEEKIIEIAGKSILVKNEGLLLKLTEETTV
ncbi:Crp/Fnr family transcriptional regulator [Mucilaginibacter sp. OK283]|uniref:Crp/Fnr family transcriptional regulator n=1 Tax=Mucilaginibacter sp. OK283 TaxID=1881049 RepID=UPI0008BBFB1F|nr:Crp/Fnr family transcriptional regulator [Mucilaginibacter sp. OK283]SEO08980.1 cAMP-binding domain of CRP or a regulatory subunit of cAMP-dependent protein kinases [Mucilaginibacter sp. OK283]